MNNTQAWQDQARNGSGEFGHRIHPEQDTFTPPASAAADAGAVSVERCSEIRDTAATAGFALAVERDEATRRMNGAGLTAAAATVRAKFPNAAVLRVEDDDEGGIYWQAKDSNGDSIDIEGGELEDELYEYGHLLTMDRPSLMEEYATTVDGQAAFESQETHSGYRVAHIEVDIDHILAAAPNN